MTSALCDIPNGGYIKSQVQYGEKQKHNNPNIPFNSFESCSPCIWLFIVYIYAGTRDTRKKGANGPRSGPRVRQRIMCSMMSDICQRSIWSAAGSFGFLRRAIPCAVMAQKELKSTHEIDEQQQRAATEKMAKQPVRIDLSAHSSDIHSAHKMHGRHDNISHFPGIFRIASRSPIRPVTVWVTFSVIIVECCRLFIGAAIHVCWKPFKVVEADLCDSRTVSISQFSLISNHFCPRRFRVKVRGSSINQRRTELEYLPSVWNEPHRWGMRGGNVEIPTRRESSKASFDGVAR